MSLTVDQSNQINNLYNSTLNGAQAGAQSTTLDLGAAQLQADQLAFASDEISTSINTINEILAKDNLTEADKTELLAQKELLLAQKQEILEKQAQAKTEMDAVKQEAASFRGIIQSQKAEINGIQAQKTDLEATVQAESELIENKNENVEKLDVKIASSEAELSDCMGSLSDAASQMQQQSDQQLNQQRQAISAASAQAMAMYQAGQLDYGDMSSFIAGKISGYNSTGDVGGMETVDANESKIKAICSQLASYLTDKCILGIQITAAETKINMTTPLISSLDSEISQKTNTMKNNQMALNSKNDEYSSLNGEYASYNSQISRIDASIASVDTRIALEAQSQQPDATQPQQPDVTQPQQPTIGSVQTGATTQNGNNLNLIGNAIFKSDTGVFDTSTVDFSNSLEEIELAYQDALGQEIDTSEIDAVQDNIIETDEIIETLRTTLSDNAQKLISERLQATQK